MKIFAAIVILSILFSCTVVRREYKVTIYVSENSTVYFTPEILADIKKESEVETKADVSTDAAFDTGVIP